MKRPNYMKIKFPRGKGTLSPAVVGYFKRLAGKVLFVNFGKERTKRKFQYKVLAAGLEERSSWYPKKTEKFLSAEVELQPEPSAIGVWKIRV